jgi:hypothetical protein
LISSTALRENGETENVQMNVEGNRNGPPMISFKEVTKPFEDRITALENEVGETANAKLVVDNMGTLARRIAALENLFKHDDDARLRIMDLNHFEERISALENVDAEFRIQSLAKRIAALEEKTRWL